MENKYQWIENEYPEKYFRNSLIVILACFQFFIIFILILMYISSPYKNILVSIFLYLMFTIIFSSFYINNVKKLKSQSDFCFKLTKSGIVIKLNDSSEKILYWGAINKIREMSDAKELVIREDNSSWPYYIFGKDEVIQKIKKYYSLYH